MPTTPLGQTVHLLGCPAEVRTPSGQYAACSLIGLFDVEEYLPYEPANYVHSPFYVLFPSGLPDQDEPTDYAVEADVLDRYTAEHE